MLLIDVAAEIGVHAVKFQGLDPIHLLGDKSVEYTYPTYTGKKITENMFDMFSELTFTSDEWHKIKEHCMSLNVDLVVTCHVEAMVPLINSLDLSCNKLCTWSLNHYRMISQLAANGKPLILDSGTLDIHQLNDLRNFYIDSGGSSVYVLFDFHTSDPRQMNMSSMNQLAENNYSYGYTPQGRDNHLDFLALGLGASILEKRLTLSRTTHKNGHWKALEPSEFYDWIQLVNNCYQALGSNRLTASDADLKDSLKYYKSAYFANDVHKGDLIKSEDFVFLRPGTGVSSKSIINNYIGKHYSKDFSSDEMFCG